MVVVVLVIVMVVVVVVAVNDSSCNNGVVVVVMAVAVISSNGSNSGDDKTRVHECVLRPYFNHHLQLHKILISLFFQVLIAFFMLLPSDIETLIDFFSFAAWMFYAIVFCALLYLRYKAPNAVRPFKVGLV